MKNLKHLILLAFTTVLLFGLQGCGENRAEKDMRITDSVNAKLSTEPLLTTPTLTIIVVETKDGVVTLTGTVDTEEQAQVARQLAESVDGVTAVQSNLTVEPKTGSLTTVPTAPMTSPTSPTAPAQVVPTTPVVPAAPSTAPTTAPQGTSLDRQESAPIAPSTMPSDTQTAPMTTPQDQVQ